jgi:hypothetical protein
LVEPFLVKNTVFSPFSSPAFHPNYSQAMSEGDTSIPRGGHFTPTKFPGGSLVGADPADDYPTAARRTERPDFSASRERFPTPPYRQDSGSDTDTPSVESARKFHLDTVDSAPVSNFSRRFDLRQHFLADLTSVKLSLQIRQTFRADSTSVRRGEFYWGQMGEEILTEVESAMKV